MAAYQSLADGADNPGADGYVSTAAHPGRPEVLTAWLDGAVLDENDPVPSDLALDLFDERNEAVAEHALEVAGHALVAMASGRIDGGGHPLIL